MSSNRVKGVPAGRRRWFYPAAILLIWAIQLAFLLIFLLLVRNFLQQTIVSELRQDLKLFLSVNRSLLHGPELYSPTEDQRAAADLAFVRVVRGGEHLYFSASGDGAFDLRVLARLDPELEGCWLSLDDSGDGEKTVWNIVSLAPDEHVIIQAGRPDRSLYRLYQRILKAGIVFACIALFIAIIVTYLSFRLAAAPLARLQANLETVRANGQGLLDPSSSLSQQYQQIYHQINEVLTHNRKLLVEMQESLDNVAHDLRTPMTRLRSVAEYGLQGGNDPGRLQEALSDCLEESQRVLAMLNIMMSVAEAESGMLKLEKTSFDLRENINEIAQVYEYLAEEKQIAIEVDIADGLEVLGDRTRLSQVWANLIDNGIKYNTRNGSLTIEGRAVAGAIHVSFRDTGIGISRQEITRVWERLYRGDRSRTQQGLGLGLNYVKAVVDAHGGRIDVSSDLNRGSTFTVVLGDKSM